MFLFFLPWMECFYVIKKAKSRVFSIMYFIRVVKGKQLELYVFEKAKILPIGQNFVETELSANICALFWKQEYWKLVVDFPWPYRSIYCICRCVQILPSLNDHFYLWMFFFRKNKIRVCSFWRSSFGMSRNLAVRVPRTVVHYDQIEKLVK